MSLGFRVCAGSMLVQARGRSVVAAMKSKTQASLLRWNQEQNETKRAQNRNMQLQTVYRSAGSCRGRRARLKGVASGSLQVLQLQGQVGHEALPGHSPPPPHGSRPLPGARLLHGRPTGAMSASSGEEGRHPCQTTRPPDHLDGDATIVTGEASKVMRAEAWGRRARACGYAEVLWQCRLVELLLRVWRNVPRWSQGH